MPNKLVETLIALGFLAGFTLLLVFSLQSGGTYATKAVEKLLYGDLDDIAPGPAPAKATESAATWFTSDDYPMEALRNEWQGTVAMRYTIDRRGRAVHCTIESSSGHSVLDETSCDILTDRARFAPARDAQGRRIETTGTRRVTWRLPE